MIYRRTEKFRQAFKKLPRHIQEKSVKAFGLFQANAGHPSLGVKKMRGKDEVWEGRIDLFYRFTFHYEYDQKAKDTKCVFRNIGPHDILEDEA